MMNPVYRTMVDSAGNQRGATADAQAHMNARTGQFDHWSSAKSNAGEAVWDAVGAIPIVGGLINVARGFIKKAYGNATGKQYLVDEGKRNIGKGLLYAIPFIGTLAAGVNMTKNAGDAVLHTAFAGADVLRYGGNDAKQQYALHRMMGQNMGYGAGLASGYPQANSPGYW